MPIDKGTSKPITQLSGLQINYKDKNSCFNPPIVTTSERDALVNTDDPKNPIKDGTTVFNSDSGYEEYYSSKAGKWILIKEGGDGTGDVTGPDSSTNNNIAVFDGTTGKKIGDAGVSITKIPDAKKGKAVNATPLYMMSNLGALQFGSNDNVADTGVILVDGLTPVTFQTQGTGAEARVCTVINGELGEGSSSPSALLEINSTEGGFLHARLTTAQRDALLDPKDGLEIYNTDTKNLNIRQNGAWVEIKSEGTGNVVGPSSSQVNAIATWNNKQGTLLDSSPAAINGANMLTGIRGIQLDRIGGRGTYIIDADDSLLGSYGVHLPTGSYNQGYYLRVIGTGTGPNGEIMAYTGFQPYSVAITHLSSSTPYTVEDSDQLITTSEIVPITLPSAVDHVGRELVIKQQIDGKNGTTVIAISGEDVEGVQSITLGKGGFLRLVASHIEKGRWNIVGGSNYLQGAISGKNTLNGTQGVTITTPFVTTNSIVTITRNVGLGEPTMVTKTGNLVVGSIIEGVSFTVYSTTEFDSDSFDWSILTS